MNTGRVGLDFIGVDMDPGFEMNLKPGRAVMTPHMVSTVVLCRWYCLGNSLKVSFSF